MQSAWEQCRKTMHLDISLIAVHHTTVMWSVFSLKGLA